MKRKDGERATVKEGNYPRGRNKREKSDTTLVLSFEPICSQTRTTQYDLKFVQMTWVFVGHHVILICFI